MEVISASLAGLAGFATYFGIAIGLTIAYVAVYVLLTPQREFALIKADNVAAALAFSGSLLGFAIPLSSAIAHSVGVVDCAVWGVVALVVQVLAFVALRVLVSDLPGRISRDERASGVLVAAVATTIGLLNAACMTY